MSNAARDGAAVRIPPPLVFLLSVAAGVALHHIFLPLPLPLSLPGTVRFVIAGAVALPGVVLIAGAMHLFWRTGQDPTPWKPTPEIVSTGVYRFTRNPMYLGLALLQTALGVGLANAWIVVMVVPVLLVLQQTVIRHEEAYLAQKFGDGFEGYRSRVRRWL